MAENYDGEQLPLFDEPDGLPSAARLGWDCQELIVRTGTRNCSQESADSRGDKMGKTGHVQIEAKMNTSLDTILRDQEALKRDLYRAHWNAAGSEARGRHSVSTWDHDVGTSIIAGQRKTLRRIGMRAFTSAVEPEEFNEDQYRPHRDRRFEISEERSAAQRGLREAMERQQLGLEGLQAELNY